MNMKSTSDKPATRDVYALGDQRGRIKIGVSNNYEKRFANLQTGNADNLRKVHAEATSYSIATKVEKTARAILSSDHSKVREWINNCSDEDAIGAIRLAHEYHRGRNNSR